jgi:hypothetical protein
MRYREIVRGAGRATAERATLPRPGKAIGTSAPTIRPIRDTAAPVSPRRVRRPAAGT